MLVAQAGSVGHVGALALALAGARDLGAVCRALREFVEGLTPMTGLFIALYDPTSRMRTCVFAHSNGCEVDVSTLPPLPLTDSPASRAVRASEPVLTRDFQAAIRGQPRHDVAMDVDPRPPQSSLVVPMLMGGEVVGTVEIQSHERDAFRPPDVEVLRLAAGLAGLAAQNVRLLEETRAANLRLEERVVDRTAALGRALEDLRRQVVARDLVRRMLRDLSLRGLVRADVLREMGRDLAAGLPTRDLDEHLRAFTDMGLGAMAMRESDDGRHVFEAHDLLEHSPGSPQPTCFLALGFLEGAVAAATGSPALGAEVTCQSRGHLACRFVVAPRRG